MTRDEAGGREVNLDQEVIGARRGVGQVRMESRSESCDRSLLMPGKRHVFSFSIIE